jgi:hypothetical protein
MALVFPDISGNCEWKQIEDYPNYYVSTLGHIWNMKLQHVLPGWLRGGYKSVSLMKDGKANIYSIHSLVCRAFIPNPENKPVIDHITNKLDNSITNLRWATYSENCYNKGLTSNNTTGYKGVSYHKLSGKYMVHVNRKHRGLFETPEAAYAEYCRIAKELHGDFFHL